MTCSGTDIAQDQRSRHAQLLMVQRQRLRQTNDFLYLFPHSRSLFNIFFATEKYTHVIFFYYRRAVVTVVERAVVEQKDRRPVAPKYFNFQVVVAESQNRPLHTFLDCSNKNKFDEGE